jgi:hypothetical protein
MEKNIKQILEDIYLIDPNLKSKEALLLGLIQELLSARPDSQINEEFVNNLKLKLITERSKLIELKSINKNMFNLFSKKFIFTGAAALSLVILATFLTLQDRGGQLAIKYAGKEAFGAIVINSSSNNESAKNALADSNQASSLLAETGSVIAPTAPLGFGGGGGSSMIAPYPYEITNYKYVYNGGDFEVGSDQSDVYRRTNSGSVSSQLASIIGKMNLNMVDLNKFKDMKVNTMEIAEDREYGYSLYVDFRQNTLSISTNWEKWPTRESVGQASEMSDQEIIAIADNFLADYGINIKNYGQGEVQETQRYAIMKAESSSAPDIVSPYYTRDYANVIYPMVINGEQVYDQSGQKYGINIGIDLAYKRVTSAYNINTSIFESSTYTLETDVNKIIKFVEAGGTYGNYLYPDATKTVNIEVGKPERGLLLTWQWDSTKPYSSELFVPALIFPITSQDSQNYRTSITVPLIGEMPGQNDILPMPLETKSAQ